jgi:hypothetical protein
MARTLVNWDTYRATTQSGVTDRVFFNPFESTQGLINQPAGAIDIHNAADPDNAASKPLRITINLKVGSIGTKYRTVYPGGSISLEGEVECVAFQGDGGTPDIEITYGW